MKRFIYSIAIASIIGTSVSAQEFDDIYYNPKKDSSISTSKKKEEKKSYYIKDFNEIDVDTYNRRGQYYESAIDTIGLSAENGEDFVNTQKIQKFYNPRIVVENAAELMDVLANSYGNVEIVFENGLPYFNSIYGWPGYYNYSSWIPSWRWGLGYSSYWAYSPIWGWDYWPSWSIGPSWSWSWGPSYAWGPAWGWGPSWSWGWGPGWGRPYYADYRPNGRYPNYPGGNWANNTRPGGNINGNYSRPGYNGIHASNSNSIYNNHRTYQGSTSSANRVNGASGLGRTYSVGSDGHRRYGSSGTVGTSTTNRYGTTSSYGTSSNSHRSSTPRQNSSSSSYNSSRPQSSYSQPSGSSSRGSSYNGGGSYGSGRSSGGSYGGGRSSGGSGRGRR